MEKIIIFGAILAGGIGSRMNIADMPKQFLPLGNKPIIIHTIEKFLMCPKFDKIYIGVHPDWVLYMKDLIEKYELNDSRLIVVGGGKDRNDTLFNIINDINNNYENNDNNIIVTQDAVRPFVTQRMINENIEITLKYGACDTVVNATDTIIVSKENGVITDIPERKFLYQGQTPQSFNINLLKNMYNKLTDKQKKSLTDACMICTLNNYPVQLVKGDPSNIKITTISDYKIAMAMLGGIKFD